MRGAEHAAAGSRVGDSQPNKHNKLWWQQDPVPQFRPECMLQTRVQALTPACSDTNQPDQVSLYCLACCHGGTVTVMARPASAEAAGSEAARAHLGELVVPVEALPIMLVQDAQLPQRVKADDPYTRRTSRQCRPFSLYFECQFAWAVLHECHSMRVISPLL